MEDGTVTSDSNVDSNCETPTSRGETNVDVHSLPADDHDDSDAIDIEVDVTQSIAGAYGIDSDDENDEDSETGGDDGGEEGSEDAGQELPHVYSTLSPAISPRGNKNTENWS